MAAAALCALEPGVLDAAASRDAMRAALALQHRLRDEAAARLTAVAAASLLNKLDPGAARAYRSLYQRNPGKYGPSVLFCMN
jgi:hypothetical protein